MPDIVYSIGETVTVEVKGQRTTGRVVSVESAEHLKHDQRRGYAGIGQILIVQPDCGEYVRVHASKVVEP
jgi:hypothetical protein